MSQRFEGKSLEEALTAASETLGVQRYQLTYHVVLEKRGFLGGMKRVVIEADINTEAAQPAAAVREPRVEQPLTSHETRPARPARAARGARGGRSRGGDRGERGGRHRERNDEDQLQPGDFAEFAAEIPEQTPESVVAAEVRAWCERAVALAKLELQVRSEETDAQIIIRLYGRDTRKLTDRHGELLDALQVLANKALTGRKTEKDIELDCQEFKGRRTEQLEQKAKRLADEVRRDGREQVLPAMTPIERRIVHLALRDDSEVTTESRGEGFYKRVAIIRRRPDQEQTPSVS